MVSDYSQPLGPSGDVFGYGVDPEAVAVHRVAQAAAGSGTRLHASRSRHQQQDAQCQHGPQRRRTRRHPAATWPSSTSAPPSMHPALSPAHCGHRPADPVPSFCLSPSGLTDHCNNLFSQKSGDKTLKVQRDRRHQGQVEFSSDGAGAT